MKVFADNLLMFFKAAPKEIFLFTVMCTLVSAITLQLVDAVCSRLFVKMTGLSFVNLGNMLEVAEEPFTYLSLLGFMIIATFFSLFEISGLIHAYSMIQIGRGTSLLNMVGAGLHTCKRTLNPVNWSIIFFLIVLLPITGILTLSSAGYKVSIPYFIIQGIESNRSVRWLGEAGYVLLVVLELCFIFSINVYVMEEVSFPTALKRGYKLGRGYEKNTLLALLLVTVVLNFLINSVASVIPINIGELIALLKKTSETSVIDKSISIGTTAYALRSVLKTLIAPPVNCAALTILYFDYTEERSMLRRISPVVFRDISKSQKKYETFLKAAAAVFALLCAVNLWHYRYLLRPIENVPEICAHRGDNVHAPENTMPSFQLAQLEMVEWVEADVIQTKDRQLVLSHDYNLRRMTGHNIVIAESTYDELQKYPMGNWLPGNYNDTTITVPKLEELLQLVSDSENMKIQIEIKPTDGDVNFEEDLVKLIHQYKLEDRCMVISLHGHSIERMKEVDPTITTAVCVNLAWKEFGDVPYTDNLSISDNGVTPDLVKQMHDAGMKVFCWTVDNKDDVQYLVSCGVDVIGTNDPLAIQDALYYADYSGGLSRVWHILKTMISRVGR